VCAFMYAQSEKGHASERNETHENTTRSARTRKCRRPTRTAATACGCLPTERCTTGWMCVCVCVCVFVCECVFVCVRETEREKERESERDCERERESEREKERERVCVHLCMYKVRSSTQVKGTKRMRTQLTLRVHEDVAVRHERLLLHADACPQSAVRLAGFVCVCVCLCVSVCLCVCERQRERKRERASESERERGRARERKREVKGTKRMKTQLALRVHEDVAVRHERLLLHAMLADRALYDWQARLQRVPVVVALAPAHREVTAVDNVLVEDARVCGGHWLALRPHTLQSVPGSRCSPTSSGSAA